MRRESLSLALQHDLADVAMQQAFHSVAPEEYCQLAVSSRPLVRWDDSAQGLKGLRDTVTGEFFMVEAVELSSYNVTTA